MKLVKKNDVVCITWLSLRYNNNNNSEYNLIAGEVYKYI